MRVSFASAKYYNKQFYRKMKEVIAQEVSSRWYFFVVEKIESEI